MSISNYTPSFCEYKRSQLKDVVYLLTEEDYNKVTIANGAVYNLNETTPIVLNCYNVEFTEEETLDERYKFTKTLKFTMKGYNNIDTLGGGLYAIIFTTEGGAYLVNSEFPPKITYNYNLSDTQDETQFTLYSQSNIPSVEVLPSIEPTISIDCEYKGYGIDTIKFADKDYASLNENTNTITLYDGATVKDVEWLEGSCSFQESFDGERVIDTITFDIDMDTWDSTWHLKLLEFNKNRYSAIVTPKYHSSKFIVGFNFGLQASYSTYATNENGQNNKITITFKETSKNGVHIAQSVSYATNSEKSWQYVQKVLADGNYEVDTYECVDTNIARYIVQEEVDSSNNPTKRYKVFSGYSGSFGDLLNVVGTFNEDVRFFTTKCSWKSKQIDYRWVEVPNDYICSCGNKMTKEKGQQSVDGGAWEDTNPLQIRAVLPILEEESPDCGCVPPTPTPTPPEGLLYKYWGCDGESSETLLTYDSVYDTTKQNYFGAGNNKVYIGNAEDDYFGFIGDFVYQVVHEMLGSSAMAQLHYKSMTIPNNVFSISLQCLGSNIENIQLPKNLLDLNIGISGNSVTSGFTLPETLCTLNLGVKNSSNFKSIVIPKNVSRIGESVYKAGSAANVFNSDLESVTIKSLIPPYVDYWSQSKISSGLTIYVPTSAVNRYKEAWPNWSSHISGGVTTDDSFSDNYKYKVIFNDGTEKVVPISSSYLGINDIIYDNVTSITISDTVKYVDMNAFDDTYHGKNVVTLTLGRNVKVLTNSGSFEGEGLRNVTLNDGLIMIGNVFGRSLTSISLPSSLLIVGERTFEGCSGLTSINIPNSVKHIYDRAFENAGLTDVIIPSSVISLGFRTFRGCTNLSSVTLNNGLKLIDSAAFVNCRSLSAITIPSSVKFVGGSAFSGCSNLTEITFQSSEPPLLDNTQYSHGATTKKATTFDGLMTNYTIYVPASAVETYKADRWFSQYSSRIQPIP